MTSSTGTVGTLSVSYYRVSYLTRPRQVPPVYTVAALQVVRSLIFYRIKPLLGLAFAGPVVLAITESSAEGGAL